MHLAKLEYGITCSTTTAHMTFYSISNENIFPSRKWLDTY